MPIAKWRARTDTIAAVGKGLIPSVVLYNSLAVSTLAFVAQFVEPPPSLLKEEKRVIQKLAKGAFNAVNAQMLLGLKGLGLPVGVRSIRASSLASAARACLQTCSVVDACVQRLDVARERVFFSSNENGMRALGGLRILTPLR